MCATQPPSGGGSGGAGSWEQGALGLRDGRQWLGPCTAAGPRVDAG